ncbi:M15 family metallopeptidase [Nocardia sp. A7]|uniref:M15 family metallopeptidase n=1 Tax=Nocardia sp. A7 TaxID=2789274 RepID=UPI00397CE57E
MGFRTYSGYARSENGWRICDRDMCELVDGPFMNTAPIRSGAPAVILGDFVRRYHAECAPIISPVWGWSPTNAVPNSNHLSGTALDINAPQWPWGYFQMPADLIARIEALVDCYDGAVFWGREWLRPDEMHFQMGLPEGDSALDDVVDRILNPAPTRPDPRTDPLVRQAFSQLLPPRRRPR